MLYSRQPVGGTTCTTVYLISTADIRSHKIVLQLGVNTLSNSALGLQCLDYSVWITVLDYSVGLLCCWNSVLEFRVGIQCWNLVLVILSHRPTFSNELVVELDPPGARLDGVSGLCTCTGAFVFYVWCPLWCPR